ncbi:MAG: hypothetical protein SOR40_09425 [Rothia sp. (in: high G+C Gram-positive bacteria)]|nr:hypothetical protein [Rothia sp. (in: high G+C Gram-positive bacteria)]
MSTFVKPLATALSAGLLASSLLAVSATESAAYVSSAQFANYTTLGTTSQYHVYAEGIDWSKPVGVVFYLDGDYWNTNQSKVHSPANSQLLGMAQVANERNMVFVPVISPDHDATGNGITWWQDWNYNGDWFRSFATDFMSKHGIDRNQVWTVGHSGGAEITGFELLADQQDSWRSGGGSIMVGGGNTNGLQAAASETAKNFSLHWYIGSEDGKGVTWPVAWSAYEAASRGYSIYKAAGFKNVTLTELPGINHHNYDFPSILDQALPETPEASPYQLQGAISDYYWNQGGLSRFGQPVTEEQAIPGGSQQRFKTSEGNETIILRSEESGPVALNARGALYWYWLTQGYAQGLGYPVTDETGHADGRVTLGFSSGAVLTWTAENGIQRTA